MIISIQYTAIIILALVLFFEAATRGLSDERYSNWFLHTMFIGMIGSVLVIFVTTFIRIWW